MATQTARQRRDQARAGYDAFLAGCPSRQLLDRISDKWVALVLAALGEGGPTPPGVACTPNPRAMRYSELSRQLAGVSQKMLTQTLRSLERDGMITRTVTPTVPVTVSYELTDLGLSLQHLMREIKDWAETNMDRVLAHRAGTHNRRIDLLGRSGADRFAGRGARANQTRMCSPEIVPGFVCRCRLVCSELSKGAGDCKEALLCRRRVL